MPMKNASALDVVDNQTVNKDKTWIINFSKEIEFNELTKEGIIVADSKGNAVDVQLKVGQDNKSILVLPPANGYTLGESYILKIGTKVHSKDNKNINKEIIMKYSIRRNIKLINDISEFVKENGVYTLPKTIIATMEDNSEQNVNVSWKPYTVDTSKVGIYTFEGTISGYDNKVKLTLTVDKNILTTKEVISKYGKAIVAIEVEDENHELLSTGSGFIINANGTIVTNFHLIDGGSYAKVIIEGGIEYEVENVLNYNKEQDIAILKLKNASNLPIVALGDSSKVEVADDVVSIGNPEGLSNTVSMGIISGLNRDMGRTYKDIQTSTSIAPGSSGGALFNNAGEVIGITYAGYDTAGDLGFVIPINEVKDLLTNFKPKSLSEVNAILLTSKPQTPTGVKVWPHSNSEIAIQWSKVLDVDGYYVYYSFDGSKWYEFTDDNDDKMLLSWYLDYSALLTLVPSETTVYFKITSFKNGVESNYSKIVNTSTPVKYFDLMSTAPEPYVDYESYKVSDYEDNVVYYIYSIYDESESFIDYYCLTLEDYGWEYSHIETLSGGGIVTYYMKNGEYISIGTIGENIIILGSIH
jgi:S1-C subfamily serine protease